ncbi:MAG: polymerase epsilon subunit [Clostridia bacterium]|nr:polymerase epsilon subunit [Clostridia bacterium]
MKKKGMQQNIYYNDKETEVKGVFEKDYEGLNNDQREAVHTTDENALVLAPAGTGKTKVIALRSVYLIRGNILPDKILCLTFTNKAAKEMKNRIYGYLNEEAKLLTIKTFHAFCYTLISHEKQNSHFSFPCTIIDETDSDSIIKRIVEELKLNDEELYYPAVRGFIENVKRYSLTFSAEERYNYKKMSEGYLKEKSTPRNQKTSFLVQHGMRLLIAYQRYLRANNCIDFMDLIVETQYLLEIEGIRKKWNRKYHYIQVDEMQDTSVREYNIIKILAKDNNLAMFGDFNQTIYEWRGSNPIGMTEDFKKDFRPRSITLFINYRQTKTLLDAANDYIRNSQLYPIQCKATSQVEGSKISILQADTKYQEMRLIAQSIKDHQGSTDNIAVLTRTNDYARQIAEVLQKEQIRCSVIEDTKFFRKKEIKELLAFFEYTINPRNGHALFKLCHHPYLNMEKWLLEHLNNTKESYMYLHDWFAADSKDPYRDLFTAYEHQQLVILDVESTGLDTTCDDIIQIAAIRYGKQGVGQALDILVKPTRPVGDSYFVHGLTDEILQEKGMEPQEALKELLGFMEGAVVVGHNIQYDLQIILSMLSRYKLPRPLVKAVYDTLDLAYKVYPKLENHKLKTLSELIGTQTVPDHNAMQDILATGEVLNHLLEAIYHKTQARLDALEAYFSYIEEYKHKVLTIRQFVLEHTMLESLEYLMNTCEFKQYYSTQELKAIRELYRITKFIEETEASVQDNITQLLAYAALHYSEIEQSELFKDRIPIITVHQAKGLEFDHVYIAGCNDRVFPLGRSIKENQLSEEKRLFYVGITRARKQLFLSHHRETARSIFLDEISEVYKDYKNYSQKA